MDGWMDGWMDVCMYVCMSEGILSDNIYSDCPITYNT